MAIGIAGALAVVVVAYIAADAVSGPLLVTMPGSDSTPEITIGPVVVSRCSVEPSGSDWAMPPGG